VVLSYRKQEEPSAFRKTFLPGITATSILSPAAAVLDGVGFDTVTLRIDQEIALGHAEWHEEHWLVLKEFSYDC